MASSQSYLYFISLHSIVSPILLLDSNYEVKCDMLQVEFGPKYDICFDLIMLCMNIFYAYLKTYHLDLVG